LCRNGKIKVLKLGHKVFILLENSCDNVYGGPPKIEPSFLGGFVFGLLSSGLTQDTLGVPGEKCQWHFGNESSSESLLSRQKFGGHRMGPTPGWPSNMFMLKTGVNCLCF